MSKKNKVTAYGKEDDLVLTENFQLKVLGNNGDDTFIPSYETKKFFGNNGNDILYSNRNDIYYHGGKGWDKYITEGTVLNYSVTQDAPFQKTSNNKWNIIDNEHSTIAKLKDVEEIEFDNYTLYLDGRNNTPFSEDIERYTLEDEAFNGDLMQHVWDLEDQLFFIENSFTTDTGAKVVINSNGTYTYIPFENFSGEDSFEFSVTDGVNPPVTKTVYVELEAVADSPTLSVKIVEGSSVNSALLVIDAQLTDTDGSESLEVIIHNIEENVNLTNATKNSDGSWKIIDPTKNVILTWDKDSELNMDFKVEAITTEILNNDQASTEIDQNINYQISTITKDMTFDLSKTQAFERSYNQSFTIGDNGDIVNYELGFNVNFGFVQYIEATSNYQIDYTSYHNYSTDMLAIDIDKTNLGQSYTTHLDGSFGASINAYADVKSLEILSIKIIDPAPIQGELYLIKDSGEITWRGVSGTLSAPDIKTSSTETTAIGSDTFANLTMDVDDFLNLPVDVDLEEEVVLVGSVKVGSAELADIDLSLDGTLEQYFDFEEELDISLILEDDQQREASFTEDFVLSNASKYDLDMNDLLDIESDFDLSIDIENDTDLVLSADLEMDFAKGEVFGEEFGPLFSVDTNLANVSQKIYSNTETLLFTEEKDNISIV